MIPPTPGRIVWYHPSPGDPGPASNGPLAAIVVAVADERLVNLTVFSENGISWGKTGVRLAQDDDLIEQGGAQWMPFQTAQAAKYKAGGGAFGDLVKRIEALAAIVTPLAGVVEGIAVVVDSLVEGSLRPPAPIPAEPYPGPHGPDTIQNSEPPASAVDP